MAVSTKAANAAADGTTDGTDLGQWATESNAFATTGDNSYATAVLGTGKNTGRASQFSFPAFTTGDIPDGATINSVTATVEWGYTVQVVGSTLGLQLYNAGTPLGVETTQTTETEAQATHQVTSGISLADLRSAGTITANIRYRKGNNVTDTTGNLDFVSLTVDYTAVSTTQIVLIQGE
jgi:hypothetical protein